jgi:hypothetical protein
MAKVNPPRELRSHKRMILVLRPQATAGRAFKGEL